MICRILIIRKKVSKMINEQKASMIVDHVTYNKTENVYDTDIFTNNQSKIDFRKAFPAKKHIEDYVVTDGIAENSVEMRFAGDLEKADEVVVYAKLPRGFQIPTPVGNYSPDWAIAFKEGTVKDILVEDGEKKIIIEGPKKSAQSFDERMIRFLELI